MPALVLSVLADGLTVKPPVPLWHSLSALAVFVVVAAVLIHYKVRREREENVPPTDEMFP